VRIAMGYREKQVSKLGASLTEALQNADDEAERIADDEA